MFNLYHHNNQLIFTGTEQECLHYFENKGIEVTRFAYEFFTIEDVRENRMASFRIERIN